MAAVLTVGGTRGRGSRRGCSKHAPYLAKAQIVRIDKLGTTGQTRSMQVIVGNVDKMENENRRVAIEPPRTTRKT